MADTVIEKLKKLGLSEVDGEKLTKNKKGRYSGFIFYKFKNKSWKIDYDIAVYLNELKNILGSSIKANV